MRPYLRNRIVGLIALAVLVAIASVLISPAVPSAPTLLPVSGLFLIGLVILAYHPAACFRRAVLAVVGFAKPPVRAAKLEFVRASLPRRR